MTMYFLTLESIFVMSSGTKNDNVFTYFRFNLCNVLGAKNDTVMHLLTLESICVMPCDVKTDNVFTFFGFYFCHVFGSKNGTLMYFLLWSQSL